MKVLAGILITALVMFGMYWITFARMAKSAPGGKVENAGDTTRAKMTLASIAQAELGNYALKGSYAQLDELIANGGITAEGARIPGYEVKVDTNGGGFSVTARCQPAPGETCQSFIVDQTMIVRPAQ